MSANGPTNANGSWTEPPRVLVVDDEAVVCESVRRVLEGEKYVVRTCTSSREGLELVRKENYDLLLLDIKMPEIDGMEFLREARAASPATEVIVITGYATVATAVEAIRYGAFDYLQKPVSPDQLLVAVARALERRSLIHLTQRLRSELSSRYRLGKVVCSSTPMAAVMRLVEKVAPTHSTVLIEGETGTGKDLIARAIHYNSPRCNEPFVVADCASLSESLLESELFGHLRGSFTGALKDRKGLAEAARGGTLFLDEIAGISPRLQSGLLRLIEEREIRPVGSDEARRVDIRIIAASNRDLKGLVAAGEFREDLYYRLSVFSIKLPALRERPEEIPLLATHFIGKLTAEFGKPSATITPRAMAALEVHDWPGNVRELENVIERAVLLAEGGAIDLDALPTMLSEHGALEKEDIPDNAQVLAERKRELREEAVDRIEKLFVIKALKSAAWNVSEAARRVDMQRPNLHALMRKHGITLPRSAREKEGGEVEA